MPQYATYVMTFFVIVVEISSIFKSLSPKNNREIVRRLPKYGVSIFNRIVRNSSSLESYMRKQMIRFSKDDAIRGAVWGCD